jgi:alpha-mannosidase
MYRTFCVLVLGVSSLAMGAEQVVWQIGKPDHDYSEFTCAGNYQAFARRFGAKPIVFQIGRSTPGRDWPFIQPGPIDTWSRGHGKPWTIRFELAGAPRGLYTLRIEFVDVQAGSPPRYTVTINGRSGSFRLQPGGGDASLTNPRAGKPQKLELNLPGGLLKQGANEIQLACSEGSWVQYDALTLSNDAEKQVAAASIQDVSARATPLFIRRDQQVRRAVDVSVTMTAPTEGLSLRVEADGQAFDVPIREVPLFGSVLAEVGVPDSPRAIDVKVVATLGSQSKTATVRVLPQRKWRIFAAPSSHTDIGYTDTQPNCAERHNQNIDTAIELLKRYPDFRWNLEVAWQGENYIHSRSGDRLADFYRYAKEGKIGVQALYCNMLTGLCSPEAACRLTWFAHRLCRQQNIPYRSAMISDVPTQEASLPMILANAGIRYFSSGINNDRAYRFTHLQDKCPCWWEGPDGSRVLMMYTWQYAQCSQWGLDQSMESARTQVLQHLAAYENRKDYPYDAVFLHGAVSDNQPLNEQLAATAKQWNERYAFPKIILCHNAEFHEYIEKHYGDKLPVYRGSAGTYWEDGAGSSAQETALNRNAKENLANGERFLALAERIGKVKKYQPDTLYNAWRNCLLYDEHTWGAHCSISQPESPFTKAQWKIKAQFARDADTASHAALDQGVAALASLVPTEGPSLVVFNPMSWPRSDVLRVSLPPGMGVAEPDVTLQAGPNAELLVKDVPACGYRILKLVAVPGQAVRPPAADPNVIESRFYRVQLDPDWGTIKSLRDKQSGRELVDQRAPFRLNQCVHVAGGNGTRIVMNPDGRIPKLKLSLPNLVSHSARQTAAKETFIIETTGASARRIMTTIDIWNDLKRIDIDTRLVDKKLTYDKEALYFAFPFQARQPTFRYEAPAAIVNVNKDMLPGACLDWFTVQHFVEVGDADGAVTWATPDAPLVCFQDINRGKWLTQLPLTTGHLYCYAMNNYWHTNYLAGQGGDFRFRFSITSRPKTDNVASARFGWEVSNPLVGLAVQGHRSGPLPERPTSLISVAEPNVMVIGTKLAEQGGGLVVRLWEIAGQPTTAHLRLDQRIPAAKAEACSLVEEPQQPLSIGDGTIAVPIRGHGLATVVIGN